MSNNFSFASYTLCTNYRRKGAKMWKPREIWIVCRTWFVIFTLFVKKYFHISIHVLSPIFPLSVFVTNVKGIFCVASVCLQTTYRSAANTIHGCLTRKKYVHEHYIHLFCDSYYFLVKLFKVISSTSTQENTVVFHNVTLLLQNNVKHEKSVSWSNTKEHEKPLHTHFVSHIFLCYKRGSWLSHESSVAGLAVTGRTISVNGRMN